MNGPLEPMLFWESPASDIPAAEWDEYDRSLDGEARRDVLTGGGMLYHDPMFFLPPWGVE